MSKSHFTFNTDFVKRMLGFVVSVCSLICAVKLNNHTQNKKFGVSVNLDPIHLTSNLKRRLFLRAVNLIKN